MPLVVVTRNPQFVRDEALRALAHLLQVAVSTHLHVKEEGGDLTPEEVEVRFRESGPHDVNSLDFQVEVIANWFASRFARIDERAVLIANQIMDSDILPEHLFNSKRAFVWIILADAGFHLF